MWTNQGLQIQLKPAAEKNKTKTVNHTKITLKARKAQWQEQNKCRQWHNENSSIN